MALTPSNMPELGISAPDFDLPDTHRNSVMRADFAGQPLLVAFWCNHCPYVRHINTEFANFAAEYQPKGLGVVAISANDVTTHPDDSPDNMRKMAEQAGYVFPYLYDETQEVAQAYEAACTPDFFLYDADHRLVYRGRFDGSTPGNDVPVTGEELRTAVDALLAGEAILPEQNPSIGCNIKWRA
jgi:peroxiredoxin